MWRTILLLLAIASVVAIFSWMAYDAVVRLPRRRRQWTENHAAMSDNEWVRSLAMADANRSLCIQLRNGLAVSTGVPAESIGPDDRFAELESQLTFDGIDSVEIVMFLEDLMEVSIPDKIAERLPAPGLKFETVGDWVSSFIPKWNLVAGELKLPT